MFEYAGSNPLRFLDATGRGLLTFGGKFYSTAGDIGRLRGQRGEALNCILYDEECDVDAAANRYYGAVREAARKAGDLAIEGSKVAYGGPALKGGLNTQLDPGLYGETPSFLQKLWHGIETVLDIRGAIDAFRNARRATPSDPPHVNVQMREGPSPIELLPLLRPRPKRSYCSLPTESH